MSRRTANRVVDLFGALRRSLDARDRRNLPVMSDQPKPAPNQFARPTGERLDVVLIKKGAVGHNAKLSELRRVTVVADGPFEAQSHADVTKAKAEGEGWVFLAVCKPGVPHEFEMMARRRESAGLTDRTKI